jgi:hypothetical protein
MFRGKTFETNGELDVARADNVLDLEVGELGIETKLLDDSGILARGKLGVILRFCASDYHLAAGKDQCCSLGLTNTHDDSGETLGVVLPRFVRCCAQKRPNRSLPQALDVPLRFSHAVRSS